MCQNDPVTGSFTAGAERLVRVSMSVLLRIKDDERYVLFHAVSRPGSCGPPGGVIKYFPPATRILDDLDFREERTEWRPELTRSDLRGFIPATRLRRFLRWFASGAYRERGVECLVRELVEELGEVGLERLIPGVESLAYTHLRTVSEGPHQVAGKAYRQFRRFDVYDVVISSSTALALVRQLIEAGANPEFPLVVCASRVSIRHGRHQDLLVAPQTAFLLGDRRIMQDIPPVR